jgi:exosortase
VKDFSNFSLQWAARHLTWLPFGLVSLLVFRVPLNAVLNLSLRDERYSYLVLIPCISACLLYLERKKTLFTVHYCPRLGIPLVLLVTAFCWVVNERTPAWLQSYRLSLLMFGIVALWAAGFVLYFGTNAFKAAIFPICFMFLMVPMPAPFLDKMVVALQQSSAEVTGVLFRLVGVPAFKQGVSFSLPGLNIEIGEQCSGIRSSVALFIASILAGHVFLRSGSRKIFLAISTIPLVILKNALRIVTISWLAIYVNQGFLHGKLHRYGGLPFSLLDLAAMVPLILMLQKSETRAVGSEQKNGLSEARRFVG